MHAGGFFEFFCCMCQSFHNSTINHHHHRNKSSTADSIRCHSKKLFENVRSTTKTEVECEEFEICNDSSRASTNSDKSESDSDKSESDSYNSTRGGNWNRWKLEFIFYLTCFFIFHSYHFPFLSFYFIISQLVSTSTKLLMLELSCTPYCTIDSKCGTVVFSKYVEHRYPWRTGHASSTVRSCMSTTVNLLDEMIFRCNCNCYSNCISYRIIVLILFLKFK